MGEAVGTVGKAVASVETDCLGCLKCGGSVSLSVSREGWGSLGGALSVEERSLVADSRPRREFRD